jgi:4-hydroxyphenylpyruvate dioxygenase-like putative hemolysin
MAKKPERKRIWPISSTIDGTDGEFVEYASNTAALGRWFSLTSAPSAYRSKNITLAAKGVNFIVNAEPESHGARFARAHGPSACAMASRVRMRQDLQARAGKAPRRMRAKSGRWNSTSRRLRVSAAV